MSYELHKKSAEALSSAEMLLEEARKRLKDAEQLREQARREYERILEEAKKEVTPEMVEEAYGEYKNILERRVLDAMKEGNYAEARKLLEELEGLKKEYGEAQESAEESETPMRAEIDRLLEVYNIVDSKQREHYYNRAGYLRGLNYPADKILEALKREMITPVKKRKIVFPWTGNRR